MKNEFRTAEFRVKTPSVKWEDCEVVDTLNDASRADADERAQNLADLYGEEVRWNWVGGDNGHYFGGDHHDR